MTMIEVLEKQFELERFEFSTSSLLPPGTIVEKVQDSHGSTYHLIKSDGFDPYGMVICGRGIHGNKLVRYVLRKGSVEIDLPGNLPNIKKHQTIYINDGQLTTVTNRLQKRYIELLSENSSTYDGKYCKVNFDFTKSFWEKCKCIIGL